MTLFTAGPAQLSPQIASILSLPTLHHRSKEFQEIFDFCHNHLLQICPMQEVFFLCCSGSGAMESAICSFSPRHLLILENGKFSSRWGEIAKNFSISTTILSCPWDRSHTLEEVKKALKENPNIDGVCLCGVESSGGVREKYEEICKAIKEHDPSILTFLDAIALFGSEHIEIENIDVLVASSQKVLGLPVGLGMVFVSSRALEILHLRSPLSYYLALQNYLTHPIAFSLPSHLCLALKFVLKHIDLMRNSILIKKRFEETRELLASKGVALYSKNPSFSIIAFDDPQNSIKTALAKQNILISSGGGYLKNSISRIGNFGGFQEYQILLKALQRI
ncbi:alanine--glyoxylate aminotransferase family protein [Helicobacter pylori]